MKSVIPGYERTLFERTRLLVELCPIIEQQLMSFVRLLFLLTGIYFPVILPWAGPGK